MATEPTETTIAELQARLIALAVKPGERPTPEAEEEMASLRLERDRAATARSAANDRLRLERQQATHTLRFELADSETATFEKAYEPIRQLLIQLRDAGVVVDWGWPDAR